MLRGSAWWDVLQLPHTLEIGGWSIRFCFRSLCVCPFDLINTDQHFFPPDCHCRVLSSACPCVVQRESCLQQDCIRLHWWWRSAETRVKTQSQHWWCVFAPITGRYHVSDIIRRPERRWAAWLPCLFTVRWLTYCLHHLHLTWPTFRLPPPLISLHSGLLRVTTQATCTRVVRVQDTPNTSWDFSQEEQTWSVTSWSASVIEHTHTHTEVLCPGFVNIHLRWQRNLFSCLRETKEAQQRSGDSAAPPGEGDTCAGACCGHSRDIRLQRGKLYRLFIILRDGGNWKWK